MNKKLNNQNFDLFLKQALKQHLEDSEPELHSVAEGEAPREFSPEFQKSMGKLLATEKTVPATGTCQDALPHDGMSGTASA